MRFPILAICFGILAILPSILTSSKITTGDHISFAALGLIYAIMFLAQTVSERKGG